MFGWLKRLFRIFSAEAHSALDKMEDPVKMTEQALRELKTDLSKSMTGLAEVKALAIRERKSYEQSNEQANEYGRKAELLIRKAMSGEIDELEADRLAASALEKKEQIEKQAKVHLQNVQNYDGMVKKMEVNVQKLKQSIDQWENEAKTLKARAKVSEATKRLNKQLTNVDSNDTMAMLERMKEKVEKNESEAQAYADLASSHTSVDDEINKALGKTGNTGALSDLKSKLSQEKKNLDSSNNNQPPQNLGLDKSESSLSELKRLKAQLRGDKID